MASQNQQFYSSEILRDEVQGDSSFLANFGVDGSFADISPTAVPSRKQTGRLGSKRNVLRLTESAMSDRGLSNQRSMNLRKSRGAFSGTGDHNLNSMFKNLSDDSLSDDISQSDLFEQIDLIQQERLAIKK